MGLARDRGSGRGFGCRCGPAVTTLSQTRASWSYDLKSTGLERPLARISCKLRSRGTFGLMRV